MPTLGIELCDAGFEAAVSEMSEIMEVHRMAGEIDYLLRVAVKDMDAYDDFYRRFIARVPLKNVTSRFSMERVKSTTAYPLNVMNGQHRQAV